MICGSGIKNSKQLRAKSRFESSQTTFADFFPFLSFCRFIFFMTNDYLRSNLIFWELLEGKIFGRKKKICLVLHSGKMARLRFLSLNAFSNLMEREREFDSKLGFDNALPVQRSWLVLSIVMLAEMLTWINSYLFQKNGGFK